MSLTIQNRPFATDLLTGFMLPDGIFISTLGSQVLNAQVTNVGATSFSGATVYVEGASHPGIVIAPATHNLGTLGGAGARTVSWSVNLSACPAGTHSISFVLERGGARQRVIKKIFVTRITFDPTTVTFSAETPEGILRAQFHDLVKPKNTRCCPPKRRPAPDDGSARPKTSLEDILGSFRGHDAEFELCLPGYLPGRVTLGWVPTPAYEGQYSDLPFTDPWWKVLFCIIALILLIAAAIVAATSDEGDITVTTTVGGTDDPSEPEDCCGLEAEGGSSSYVVAGLVTAAAVCAAIAAASDVRDIFRRGQDQTAPAPGELTTAETINARFYYPEPVALGRPFAAGVKWEYERLTTGGNYAHASNDVNENIHVLDSYQISAPDVAYRYKRTPWIVKARLFEPGGRQMTGAELFVQCFLAGPNGEWRKFLLEDSGRLPDGSAGDGVYTGEYLFAREPSAGLWRYFVIAQDINHARPNMEPEEAAQIIGGIVRTHQLVITFDEQECPFVPDGHVNVI